MDRLIALLAALVGLIALAGAILVQLNGQNERVAIAASLAALDAKVTALSAGISTLDVPAPVADTGFAEALLALQDRIARLEEASKAEPVPAPVAAAPTPANSAITADGPTTDCIPLGTRFVATAGDETAICKTDVVVKVTDVTDGFATIDSAGPVAAGGFGKLGFGGCTVMVFSADLASGYAEMRVSCE